MVLHRTDTIASIVPGSTTLLPVEFPVSSTPGFTSVLYGYDTAGIILQCYTQGHQVSYYSASGCDVYVP